MMKFFQIIALSALASYAAADIIVDNAIVNPEEVYDFVFSTDSDEWWKSENTKKYYCIYRNLWTKVHHPEKYPRFARLSDTIMYSSTTGFSPWIKTKRITNGVESLIEAGFNENFLLEITRADTQVLAQCKADSFTIDQEKWENNYVFMPGVEVSDQHRYLNGITAMLPSPDWFTGFYFFDTLDPFDLTFLKEFLIHTYPWDGGTDDGDTYTAFDKDAVPAKVISRFTPQNSPGGIFVSPEGTVKPVGEMDCRLYVCDPTDTECELPNWPPKNGCDVFRFPNCDQECNPSVTEVCEECTPNTSVDGNRQIFYPSCCQSNREPLVGTCAGIGGNNGRDSSDAASVAGLGLAAGLAVGAAALFL